MTAAAAVLIPHYNDHARLARCLDALVPQLDAAPRPVEVIVVDNRSDPALGAAFTDRWPQVRFVLETEKGAAPARNRGVAESTAESLFFLDCDCVPAEDWLASAFAVAGRAALVGGRIDVFDETPPPRSGAEAFEAVFAFDNRQYIEKKGFSVTANLVTRRAVFERIGGFRAGMSEDLDWCHRATAAGFDLVFAEALRVGHPARADWPALRRKWLRLTEETWGLQQHGPVQRLRWGLRALVLPLSALVHTPRVLRSDRLASGRERRAALATLVRLRLARGAWMLGQVFSR
ncbi:glycosyltransferase family 2 protein [Tropicibacter sp. S64]|uniref:glycosyltransferase family 2 protein n=1 Tax=Tropicibacter sp. S64 TaxID=3415122 RepID=UPI003C79F9DE